MTLKFKRCFSCACVVSRTFGLGNRYFWISKRHNPNLGWGEEAFSEMPLGSAVNGIQANEGYLPAVTHDIRRNGGVLCNSVPNSRQRLWNFQEIECSP